MQASPQLVKLVSIIRHRQAVFIHRYQHQQYSHDESMVVEKALSPEKINGCLNLVSGDFRRLQKNKDFAEYTRNRKITIQIFDNSGSNIPLHAEII